MTIWYRDRGARLLIARGYLPWLGALNLAWETAQMPLYTLWQEAEPAYIAFSVVHCTLGDLLIGTAALLVALIAGREAVLARWRWRRVAVVTTLVGASYTVFSEWMNIAMFRSWSYSESMPTLEVAGFELGLAPLAQWLVVPPLALYLAGKTRTCSSTRQRE